MNLNELLADEGLRQREFPVVKEMIFLGHGGVCPLPRRVSEALAEYARRASEGDQESFSLASRLVEGRALAARLLRCQPEEIAFVGPTSLALSFFASGLKFRRGDNILIYFEDYPSNVYPWMALAEKGVEVRLMNTRGLGVIRPQDVMGQVDENTRLVALASCHFISGYRIDLAAIGAFLRSRGILFCVDGIQTLGAFPTTVEWVDMLAADAHKWMLGPSGAGILYVRREVQAELSPPIYGWHNVKCPDFVSQERLEMRGDARKYEAGTHNVLGLVGLSASMELIEEVGVEQIAEELLRKRRWLVPELQKKGYEVLNAETAEASVGGIVSFSRESEDMAGLHEKLRRERIVCHLRVERAGRRWLRLSAHFYNTDAELRRLLEVI
jgi:selenocysteine lyase/cysteine desulfurase